MAEGDPAEGAVAHCFLRRVQLAVCSRHLLWFFFSSFPPVWFRHYKELTRWLILQEVCRDSDVLISVGGQWTVCILLSVSPFIFPSLKQHHSQMNKMGVRLRKKKNIPFNLRTILQFSNMVALRCILTGNTHVSNEVYICSGQEQQPGDIRSYNGWLSGFSSHCTILLESYD